MNQRFERSCKRFNLFVIGGHTFKKIFTIIEEQNRVSIITYMLCLQHFHNSVIANSKWWVVTNCYQWEKSNLIGEFELYTITTYYRGYTCFESVVKILWA